VLGLDLDTQARTGEAQPLKTVDELIGQRLGRESGDVDSRDGRIELSRDPELGWWTTARAGMLVQASGQPVCPYAFGPETGGHGGPRQGRQVAEGAQAQADK
jgi:hypothetical protein